MPDRILQSEATAALREARVNLVDASGLAVTGLDATKVTIKLSKPGTTSYSASTATLTEITGGAVSDGEYRLLFPQSEMSAVGEAFVEITSGSSTIAPFKGSITVYPPLRAAELASDAINAIRDSILTFAFRSGRTIKGFFRRMDGLYFGKATGLNSATPTLYQPDGTTVEFTATQDVALGTRSTVDATVSET